MTWAEDRGERLARASLKQLCEWASAYVDNETCIPETPDSELSDAQKGALQLIAFAKEMRS